MAKREFVVGDFDAVWGDQDVLCGPGVIVPVARAAVPRLRKAYKEWSGLKGKIYRLVKVPPAKVKEQAERERKARARGKR